MCDAAGKFTGLDRKFALICKQCDNSFIASNGLTMCYNCHKDFHSELHRVERMAS